MPDVIVGAFPRLALVASATFLGPVQRLDLRTSSMLSTIAPGGFRYSPTTSVTLATSQFRNLNVSTRHGLHSVMPPGSTVEASTPRWSASSRDD